jgi:hypothetical protein
MADQLKFEVAQALARSLTTIDGFPRFDEALTATAEDLVRWCKGAFIEGKQWSAESQAYWLVTEAREKMADRWQGTGALLAIFNQKFVKPVKSSNEFIDYSNEPCICGSGERFRLCCQGKPLPPLYEWLNDKKTNPPPQPPNRLRPITQEDIDRLRKERDKPQ